MTTIHTIHSRNTCMSFFKLKPIMSGILNYFLFRIILQSIRQPWRIFYRVLFLDAVSLNILHDICKGIFLLAPISDEWVCWLFRYKNSCKGAKCNTCNSTIFSLIHSYDTSIYMFVYFNIPHGTR